MLLETYSVGVQIGTIGGGLPQWLIAIIVITSCATFSVFIIVLGRLVKYYTDQQNAGMVPHTH